MPRLREAWRDPAAALGPRPVKAAALVVLALTAWRIAALGWAATDLYTDESQYWFWSTDLAWGYFSKPPMIAAVIRLATELGGSEAPFWVRLPAPLFHAAGAAAVGALGAAVHGARTGALAALAYATLPAVAVGSIVISTDTLLLPFAALAILAWLRTLARPGPGRAAALGLALGVGLYAKYAILYLPLGMVAGALVSPRLRLARRDIRVAAGVFLLVVLPHLAWSLSNGFVTAAHVAADAQAGAGGLHFDDLGEFLGAQLGVFGPILFPAFLWAVWRVARGRGSAGEVALAWTAAPALALVSVQALRAGAEPSWAAIAYAGATPLAVALLLGRAPRLLALSLALHLAVSLALPVATAWPEALRAPNGRPFMARLLGREALAREIAGVARAEGLDAIVAVNRGVVSDLLYALRDEDFAIYAPPPAGAPANHFEMTAPLPPDLGRDILWVGGAKEPQPPPGFALGPRLGTVTPESGYMARRTLSFWRMEAE